MFKKFFIPHEGNKYKPHALREASIITLLVLIFLAFITFSIILPKIDKSKLGAAIYSSVLVDSTNQDRQNQSSSLSILTVNPKLVAAAQAKANDMAKNGYFAHNSPTGLTPWYWIKEAGYNYIYAGENLAVDFNDSSDVDRAWMNSPTHKANILNTHYTEIGIAMATGILEGHQTTFVVQMFGSPSLVAVAPTEPQPVPIAAISEPEQVVGSPIINEKPVAVGKPIQSPIIPIVKKPKEVVSPTNTFVAVQRVEGEQDQLVNELSPTLIADASYQPNAFEVFFKKVIVNPSHSLAVTYGIISIFLILAIVLCIFVERKVQHPKNIFYGILLLVIILVLTSMHWIISLSGNAIV